MTALPALEKHLAELCAQRQALLEEYEAKRQPLQEQITETRAAIKALKDAANALRRREVAARLANTTDGWMRRKHAMFRAVVVDGRPPDEVGAEFGIRRQGLWRHVYQFYRAVAHKHGWEWFRERDLHDAYRRGELPGAEGTYEQLTNR